MTTTITEALAELKTLKARIAKKREHVQQYILRDGRVVDPLEKDGGSRKYVTEGLQAISDMEARYIRIRNVIQVTNLITILTLGDRTLPITDWLNWRRDISSESISYLKNIANSIARARRDLSTALAKVENAPEGFRSAELIINLDEKNLLESIESIEKLLGDLDGKLSLLNATTLITVTD